MSVEKESDDRRQYLTFFLVGEEYAISILKVKEIIEYGTLTRVPAMPAFIRGVINLRGSVVPVIDLAVKFGSPETLPTKWTCIIIVELDYGGELTALGLMADSVNNVLDLLPEQIEPPPEFGTRIRIDYLLGMGKRENKFALILDIDRVLSIDELLAIDSLMAPAHPPAEPPQGPKMFQVDEARLGEEVTPT